MSVNRNNVTHISLRWGGAAGDGLQSTGNLLQKYLNRLGYYVHGFPGTQSTIRGGHVWQHVEMATESLLCFNRPLDILIALTTETLHVHLRDIRNGGILLYNSDKVDIENFRDDIAEANITLLPLPLTAIAREVDLQTPILANTVAVGALLEVLELPLDVYVNILEKRFAEKESIQNLNKEALFAGKNAIMDLNVPDLSLVLPDNPHRDKIVVTGNDMIALAAAASGLKFLAQYPITPASSILTYLSHHAKDYGIVVRQAEDELAAINMIIGAAYSGVRAMTASSGPGLSLMAESFGYAAMTETPIVIVNSMRGGPSTGIPTKMEQADLNAMINLSHGESPRLILAPRSIREAYYLTVRAFNLADRFQIPVILLSDFALSERTSNIKPVDLEVEIDRGLVWKGPSDDYPQFKRFQLTETGVSPRAFPGTTDAEYILVGAEHDEESHSLSGNRCGLPESWELREKMIKKRYRKMELLRDELEAATVFGSETADFTLLCWGSTEGAVQKVSQKLTETTEYTFNVYSFADIYPLPFKKIKPQLTRINKSIMIEVNYTGQFEELLHTHLQWRADHRIHPLSGETPTPYSLEQEILPILEEY